MNRIRKEEASYMNLLSLLLILLIILIMSIPYGFY
jgi:hypothetical protein